MASGMPGGSGGGTEGGGSCPAALEARDEAAAAGAAGAAGGGGTGGSSQAGGASRLAPLPVPAAEDDPELAESAPCPTPAQPPHHLMLLLRRSPSTSLCLVQEEDAGLPAAAAAANTGRAGPAGRAGPPAPSSRGTPGPPASSAVLGDDVRKCGYLRKQKHGHKRYFVLREESHLAPARLEYYDSEKKFKSSLRAAAGGNVALCCPPPKRVIPLYQCFTVSRRADAKHKHIIALYTKDEYFAMVAENEAEQEGWYQAISELMSQSKRGFLEQEDQADQQLDDDDEHYGAALRPGTVFKEVWQVNVKPKGLGQTKNLTGVYRLCLSSKAIHLVKLNTEVPSVHLQLMNVRRCGHSENFFFIEVGRSASIGPGELWMQVDDSVVAQNMHETFLETMKALKAFSEFRPRSKSQSSSGGGSSTNPISFITTRRHLGNLPPSQTGLQRRSRTESVTGGTPPTTKSSSAYRFRTSSEGEGTMTRPFRSVTGSLIHLNTARMNLGRQEGSGRYVRAAFSSSYHTRSASLPVSHFPSTTSPISVSSSSGHGSASDTLVRPSSSSVCGSPSDGGFISSDEYGSSPGDFRYFRVRSNTPDSLGNTPPIREENCLSEYMSMSKQQMDNNLRDDYRDAEKCFRKRTYSLTKPASVPVQQKTTQTAASLDEDSVGSHGSLPCSESPKFKENPESHYGEAVLDAACSQSRNKARDDGYMPMMPGVASSLASNSDYLPMTPKNVSVPKQINNSWSSPQADSKGYMMMFPRAVSSPVRSPLTGFNSKSGNEKLVSNEYMDMSPGNSAAPKQPSDSNYMHTNSSSKNFGSYFSLPRSFKTLLGENGEHNEYVPMSSPGKLLYGGSEDGNNVGNEVLANGLSKSPHLMASDEGLSQNRVTRPTRLPLGTRGSNTIPRMYDRTIPLEPSSPGEYINIDFGEKASNTPYSLSAEGSPSSLGSSSDHRQSPLSDYMSVDLDVQSPKATKELSNSLTDISIYASSGIPRNPPDADYARLSFGSACVSAASDRIDDYTEMTFNMAATPPGPFSTESKNGLKIDSPPSIVNRLCIVDQYAGSSNFSGPNPEPPVVPKVIRADPQGRRRHSSETFSSAGTVTTSSSFFTDSSKRHSSASFDNVWLKPEEHISDGHESKMSRDTSTGFQNGLNYIALNLRDNSLNCEESPSTPNCHLPNGTLNLESGVYVSIDFSRSDGLKCNSARKGL